ncbi:MAG: ABC transporter ATP-binding protein [Alphaproteobacteria bacterium]|nr:ABC transporter ATP-binding protein [Alphaproteobacteria bacterium]
MLAVEGVVTAYGRIVALRGVSLDVSEGEIVALIGANGAGKTTLLRVISGIQPIQAGHIHFAGESIDRLAAHRRVAKGILHVPEGRQVFGPLCVEDHLRLGAYLRKDAAIAADIERLYARFPRLKKSRHRAAGNLSGGEQQMLAIGRALMGRPRLLLLDEPSMGLAPMLVDEIFDVIIDLKATGITVLLVEQNAVAALAIADRGYVIETGAIVHSGTGRVLLEDPKVRASYLGL